MKQRDVLRETISKHYASILIFPAFFTVLILVSYPFLITIRTSLYFWTFGTPWREAKYVASKNYEWILLGGDYLLARSIQVTLIFVVAQVIGSLALGLGIALLLRKVPKGGSLVAAGFLIPMVVMPAVVGLMWRLYFAYYGFVNYFLEMLFGLKINWYSIDYALVALTISNIWMTTPFFVLVFYAALTSLPREPFEAAQIDGASRWMVFKDITLPMLKPVILVTTIIRTIDAFRIFDAPYVMFGGGPGSATEVLAIHINRVAFSFRRLGAGSVLSLLLIFIVMAMCSLLIVQLKKTWRA